ncbi:MAG: phytanoyl-CoA dioxygenase family protein [Gammaproteobacteria bacterium]
MDHRRGPATLAGRGLAQCGRGSPARVARGCDFRHLQLPQRRSQRRCKLVRAHPRRARHRTFASRPGPLGRAATPIRARGVQRDLSDSARISPFHWDGDPRRLELMVQGLVLLTDTDAQQGGVALVPEFYKRLDDWVREEHTEQEWRRPDCSRFPVVRVPGKAGTLVIWHRRMPHTSALNRGNKPRFVQYVTMSPAGNDEEREERVRLWREKIPPPWAVRQNVPLQQNPEPGDSPTLTALGRKLVGVDAW